MQRCLGPRQSQLSNESPTQRGGARSHWELPNVLDVANGIHSEVTVQRPRMLKNLSAPEKSVRVWMRRMNRGRKISLQLPVKLVCFTARGGRHLRLRQGRS